MKKKPICFLSAVLAVLTVLLILPASLPARAANLPGMPEDREVNGIHLRKHYVDGILTLEAYAAGKIVTITTETPQPADIVLVLDTSGSMEERIGIGSVSGLAALDREKGAQEGYYALRTSVFPTVYRALRYRNGTWQRQEQNGLRLVWRDLTSLTRTERNSIFIRRIDALKDAVGHFIDTVEQRAAADDVDHRVSIVRFSSARYPLGQSPSLREGNHTGYTELVKNLTPVRTGKDDLLSAVHSLEADGSTAADYGMAEAALVLGESNPAVRPDSGKVVVLFTDGEPNHGSGFRTEVADAAILAAKELKDRGVRIYSVGVFDSPSDNVSTYMNAVSSNYPGAVSMAAPGSRAEDASGNPIDIFSQNAKDSAELSGIFTFIAQTSSSGGAYTSIGTETVVRDILSAYFVFPEDTLPSDILVSRAEYLPDSDSFGPEIPAPELSVTMKTEEKTVEVTGFDFSAHWCGSGAPDGQKLILRIPAVRDVSVPIDDAAESGLLPTNAPESGLYIPAEDGEECCGLFPLPYAPVAPEDLFTVIHCSLGDPDGTARIYSADGAFDFTRTVSSGMLYGGTFTDPGFSSPVPSPFRTAATGGKVYYLWELSEDYLIPATLSVWRTCGENGKNLDVTRLCLLSALDLEERYTAAGFLVGDSLDYAAGIFRTLTVTSGSREAAFVPRDIFGADGVFTGVRIGDFKTSPLYAPGERFTILAYLETRDHVRVTGTIRTACTYLGVSPDEIGETPVFANAPEDYCSVRIDARESVASARTPAAPAPLRAPLTLSASFRTADEPGTEGIPLLPERITVTVHDSGGTRTVSGESTDIAALISPTAARGKLFAGWFRDAAHTIPADLADPGSGTELYARYVSDANLRLSLFRSPLGGSVTLLSAAENGAYREIFFLIDGEKLPASAALSGSAARLLSGGKLPAASTVFTAGADSRYFSVRNKKISVTVCGVTPDGTTVVGESRTVTLNSLGILRETQK